MCGFVAILGKQKTKREIHRMALAVAMRGPDDSGEYITTDFSAIHHRLAIIGADERGYQPMQIDDIVVVFNGCIYNYQALRQQFEKDGIHFQSDCDTEILLHLYQRFGTSMFAMLHGMFAIVLWDKRNNICLIARDAFGEKPLFVCAQDGRVGFSSLLSGFEKGDWALTPNLLAVRDILLTMRVEAPRTMYQEVSQLPAGCYAIVKLGEAISIRRYHFLPDEKQTLGRSPDDVQNDVKTLIEDAFCMRMISDKPLGIFLSGGVDSSLIAGVLARQVSQPLHTFSVRFSGGLSGALDDYDESGFAQTVADYLGTNHQTLEVNANAQDSLNDLALAFDQPISNAAALPMYLISQAAKPYVDVALSGVGGDELFGGYPRYLGMAWHQRLGHIPGRNIVLACVQALGDSHSSRNMRGRLRRFLQGLNLTAGDAYLQWMRTDESQWQDMFTQAMPSSQDEAWQSNAQAYGGLEGLLQRFGVVNGAMVYDTVSYLNDDLLAMGDRMSMAHGLELRAPFLDTRLWALMSHLDTSYKLKGMPWQENLKVMLKSIATDYVPNDIIYRPKQGFMAPIKHWLRGDLSGEVEALMQSNPLGGLVRREFVREQWQRHQRGEDRSDILWGLLLMNRWMLQRGWVFKV
ncbi:MAG: asparagine synthase (glutamine-hydrolyzing) [Mariprofundaceae bacterium]|nr:asparagine synthase (glutamine-hydrolyzing) [Mariprofundaceae bacterium]